MIDRSQTNAAPNGTLTTGTVADGVVLVTLDRPDSGNGVVPEMAADLTTTIVALEDAVDRAGRIAAKSWRATQATVGSLRSAFDRTLSDTLRANYWAHVALQPGPDVAEGLDAFLEKREVRFNR